LFPARPLLWRWFAAWLSLSRLQRVIVCRLGPLWLLVHWAVLPWVLPLAPL
jgi:hypothetical protein